MRVVALFSGGKDSVYAVHYAQQQGYDVVSLLTMVSKNRCSYMYHTIGIEHAPEIARSMGIKLHQFETNGIKEAEVEDLKKVLEGLKKRESIKGVVSGALASDYQKTRIERVCHELGLATISPLWHVNSSLYMKSVIDAGFDVRIVGVFADGLGDGLLGGKIDETTLQKFKKLKTPIHIAGEGGEYETVVVDGPGFSEKVFL